MKQKNILGLIGLMTIFFLVISMGVGCKATEKIVSSVETTVKEEVETTTEKVAESADDTVTLRFPHWWFGESGNTEKWVRDAITEFEAQNPNIKIEGYYISPDVFLDKMDTSVAGGDPPDIMVINPPKLGEYIEMGVVQPLDNLIDMDAVKQNFGPLQTVEVVAADPNGQTNLLTLWSNWFLPTYRPSLYKEAGYDKFPDNIEDFIAAIKKLSGKDSYGYATMIVPGNYFEMLFDLTEWVYGFGGTWSKNGKPNLNSTEVIQAMTYLKELYDADAIPKETDTGDYRKMFSIGKVATLIEGPYLYPIVQELNPDIGNDYEVAPPPFPAQRVSAVYWGLAISEKCKNPQEAAKFIEFLCSFDQQQKLVEEVGSMSTRLDVYKDAEWVSKLTEERPFLQEFFNQADNTVLMWPADMQASKITPVNKIWGKYYEMILYEGMDVTKAMNAAQEEAMALFQ